LIAKNKVNLIPYSAVLRVGEVMTWGVPKHGPYSVRTDPRSTDDHVEATLRHLFKDRSGEKLDSESGKPHLWHAAARLLMAIGVDEQQKKDAENVKKYYYSEYTATPVGTTNATTNERRHYLFGFERVYEQ
jgi:hypothetical protein